MTKTIILQEKRQEIQRLATKLFDHIICLPKIIRPDDTQRTGIQVLLKVLETKNLITMPVHAPSEGAQHIVSEKSARTECYGHVTSQESENPAKMKWRGCVSFVLEDGTIIHSSVSGLKGTEDVAVAIILLAEAVEKTIAEVIHNIQKRGGMLPEELFQQGHYLYDLLNCK